MNPSKNEKTYTITLKVKEDLNNYILEQTGGSKWQRGGYIRSILYQWMNNKIYLGGGNGSGDAAQAKTVKTKNNSYVVGTPIYDPSKVSMADMNAELKMAFKKGLTPIPLCEDI